jgi:hypothetical protein
VAQLIAAVPPELVAGAVALIFIIVLAGWGWRAQKKLGAVLAWLDQAKAEQEGRARFDAEQQKTGGKLGKRVVARSGARVRKPAKR